MIFPRYPRYRDSIVEWIGELPAHWRQSRIKYALSEMGSGGTPSTDDDRNWCDPSYGTAWVAIGDMSGCDVVLQTAKALTPEGLKSKDLRVWPPGTLVFSMYASLGHVASLGVPAAINQALLALVPEAWIHQSFLNYWLKFIQPHLIESSNSNTQDNLNSEKVANLPFPIAPSDEQAAICAFLDRETAKIDELIAEQERLVALLNEKRQAVISNVVTRGLDPSALLKDSGIDWLGRIPEHWTLRSLRSLIKFSTSGPRGWSGRVGSTGAIFIQSGNLNNDATIDFENVSRVIIDGSDAETSRTRLMEGDILVCITGAKTGKVALCRSAPEPSYINQHICLVRPHETSQSEYLSLVLNSHIGKTHFSLSQYGLKQGLSLQNVTSVPVPFPPSAEQAPMVEQLHRQLSVIREAKLDVERSVTLLRERRSALISAAVTGKIDVRDLLGRASPVQEAAE